MSLYRRSKFALQILVSLIKPCLRRGTVWGTRSLNAVQAGQARVRAVRVNTGYTKSPSRSYPSFWMASPAFCATPAWTCQSTWSDVDEFHWNVGAVGANWCAAHLLADVNHRCLHEGSRQHCHNPCNGNEIANGSADCLLWGRFTNWKQGGRALTWPTKPEGIINKNFRFGSFPLTKGKPTLGYAKERERQRWSKRRHREKHGHVRLNQIIRPFPQLTTANLVK